MTRKEMIGEMIDYAVREANQNEKYNNIGMSQGEEAEIIVDLWIKFGSMTDAEVEKAYEEHIEGHLEEDFECRRGDVFTLEDGDKCILALTSWPIMAFINLQDGNRWVDAIKVKNPLKVTVSEFGQMCGSCDWKTVYKTREPYGG